MVPVKSLVHGYVEEFTAPSDGLYVVRGINSSQDASQTTGNTCAAFFLKDSDVNTYSNYIMASQAPTGKSNRSTAGPLYLRKGQKVYIRAFFSGLGDVCKIN